MGVLSANKNRISIMGVMLITCLTSNNKFMQKNRFCPYFLGNRWRKMLMIMKLSFLLVCVFTLSLSASTWAQQERVSLKMQEVSVNTLLKEIQRQTDLQFIFNTEQLNRLGLLTVDFKDETVENVLSRIFQDTGLTWTFKGGIIMVKQREKQAQKQENKLIGGVVTDTKGQALPGVTVRIKGTSVGTVTDVKGHFVFVIPPAEQMVLIFSFIGMETREVKYTGQTEINVELKETTAELDEVKVVSTGYQTVNRRDMVGSFTTVRAEDVMMPAYNTIDQMLQGQVPGMVVMNTSSRVGTSPKIKIRGTTTLLGNQSPLWVVDGVIQEDPLEFDVATAMTDDLKNIIGNQISWLNPMDIETITVLKDASATAVYGSKASNGVIVITTKKGKKGHLTVNYAGNVSINTRPRYQNFNMMNSKERIQFSDEAFNWGAFYERDPIKQPYTYEGVYQMYLAQDISREEFLSKKAWLETMNTNWFDLLTQRAVSHNHNLSFSGGSDKLTYTASLGYNRSEGQEVGNKNERMTGRLSLGIQLHEKVRLSVALNGSVNTTDGFGPGVNPMSYAIGTSRSVPAYDEQGERVFYRRSATYSPNTSVSQLGYNFMNERDESGATSESSRFGASLDFSWHITDWLQYQFTGGYARDNKNNESYASERTFYIAEKYRGYDFGKAEPGSADFNAAELPFGGVLYTSDAIQSNYNLQNKLLVSKTFRTDHRLNVMLGMEVRSSATKNNANTVFGYAKDRGEVALRPTPPEDMEPIGSGVNGWGILEELYTGHWKRTNKTDNYLSFFATLAYSLKNRYVANVSVRNDASNRFGQDVNHRLDPTWSFGLSWRVTEEPFLQDRLNWLSQLTLKATYGIQGNALTRLSPELILKRGNILKEYNQYKSTILSIPNPGLSWERTKSWNFGVDLELFRILTLTMDYYTRHSNAIVDQELPFEYGTSTMKLNGGKINNQGIEFTLAITPVKTKNWGLSISLNSSKNWNKVGSSDYRPRRAEFLTGMSNKILKKGYPVGGFWSFSFAGLSPVDGRPMFNYLDIPEEQRHSLIDPTSFLVYSGEKEPYFTGGLNLSLRYKGFTLGGSFALLLGSKTRLPSPFASLVNGTQIPNPTVNLNRDLMKRWKKPGDELTTYIPGLVNVAGYTVACPDKVSTDWITAWEQSDVMVADASFFRCRQLSLGWRLEPKLCKRIGFKSLSLTATVSNLFVIASKRFNGFDPELGDSVQPKNYTLGINIGF